MYVSKFEEDDNGKKNYSGRSKQDNDLSGTHCKFILLLFLHEFSGFGEQLK